MKISSNLGFCAITSIKIKSLVGHYLVVGQLIELQIYGFKFSEKRKTLPFYKIKEIKDQWKRVLTFKGRHKSENVIHQIRMGI